jgi:hypothetical protein
MQAKHEAHEAMRTGAVWTSLKRRSHSYPVDGEFGWLSKKIGVPSGTLDCRDVCVKVVCSGDSPMAIRRRDFLAGTAVLVLSSMNGARRVKELARSDRSADPIIKMEGGRNMMDENRGSSVGPRLDALQVGSFHHKIVALVSLGLFLDGFDVYLAGGSLAAS